MLQQRHKSSHRCKINRVLTNHGVNGFGHGEKGVSAETVQGVEYGELENYVSSTEQSESSCSSVSSQWGMEGKREIWCIVGRHCVYASLRMTSICLWAAATCEAPLQPNLYSRNISGTICVLILARDCLPHSSTTTASTAVTAHIDLSSLVPAINLLLKITGTTNDMAVYPAQTKPPMAPPTG